MNIKTNKAMDMNISESTNLIKALSDKSRLLIINSLQNKPQYVEELGKRLNLATSTISFHLKKLESANLVFKKKEQYYVIFYPNNEILKKSLLEIISFSNEDEIPQNDRIEKYFLKVLNTFFANGRLIKIPTQKKKRIIILEKIFTDFEVNMKYTESEINNIISKYFDDYVTIRRYFIDENMLKEKMENIGVIHFTKKIIMLLIIN